MERIQPPKTAKQQDLARLSVARNLSGLLQRTDINVVIATMILFLIFTAINPNFFSPYNLFKVSRTAALHIFIAIGQMIVVVVGGLNLSLGNIGALSVVAAGWAMEKAGFDPAVAGILSLGVGTGCGLLGTLDIDRSKIALEARNLSQGTRFKNVSFQLRQGEILGFYGLVGSGRTELARILIGEDLYDSGSIWIHGNLAHIRSMADSLKQYRMGYVSENRKEHGLILGATIKENIAITVWERLLTPIKSISLARERALANEYMRTLDIRATGISQIVGTLSGGNQQKVSIAKWLAAIS